MIIQRHPLVVLAFLIAISSGAFAAAELFPQQGDRKPNVSLDKGKDLTALNERVRMLEQKVDSDLKFIQEQSKLLLDAQRDLGKQTVDTEMHYINVISLGVGGLVAFVGLFSFIGISQLRTYTKQAKKEAGTISQLRQEAARNQINVKALVAVTRVMSRIWHSDMAGRAGNQVEKERRAEEALAELEAAEQLMDIRSAALLLEKGKALKRLRRYEDALEQANEACDLAKTERNRFDEARANYNAACYLALLDQKRRSLKRLEQAINISSAFRLFAVEDDDLKSIREESEFKKLTSAKGDNKGCS